MATVATEERPALKIGEVLEKQASRRREAMRAVMDTPMGRLVISELLADAGILRAGFVADPYRLQFEDGQRNFGVSLMAEVLRDAPRGYLLMEQEKAQRASADRKEMIEASKGDDVDAG